jgi:hypothetical protein
MQTKPVCESVSLKKLSLIVCFFLYRFTTTQAPSMNYLRVSDSASLFPEITKRQG